MERFDAESAQVDVSLPAMMHLVVDDAKEQIADDASLRRHE
jgi:hypothetical protein